MLPQSNQVYPQDYDCIIESRDGKGGLYIGNLQAAQNLPNLKKLQIKALLTAAKGVQIGHPRTDVPFFLYIPAQDHQSFDISKFFHQASNFINDCLARTNIIVHCLAGVSRSVSLVISYLIKHKNYTYNQAYDLVKAKRRIIHPNDGFIEQLKKFEREHPPHREEYKSLSPQKTYQRRQSSFTSSPTKQYPNPSIQNIISKYQTYKNMSKATFKNPQIQYDYTPRTQTISPSKTGLKRLSSMNTETKYLGEQNIRNFSKASMISEFHPFGNIQNKQQSSRGYSDIDKRIEEIRKKYQQYNHVSSLGNYSKNIVNFSEEENKHRGRASSNYAESTNSSYSHYLGNSRQSYGNLKYGKIKRLTSFQEY